MDIKPGLSIRIVTEVDVTRERIHVRGSIIYDVKEETAILAQTDPPILKSMLHKEVTITYLTKKNDVMVRHGFPARIVEFIDYSLNSGQQVRALMVERTGNEQPYSIRMSYRAAPTTKSELSMTIYGTVVNVLDISLGGARFSYDKSLKLEPDAIVNANIEMEGRPYSLEARILRTWYGDSEGPRHDLRFASAEFVNMSRTVEHALSRKIHEIERESLHKEDHP
jgi:hypothetical protein